MDGKNKMSKQNREDRRLSKPVSRRAVLKGAALGAASLALPGKKANAFSLEAFLQKHFREMNEDEKKKVITRLQREYLEKYGVAYNIRTDKAMPGVSFGYGLDLSLCIGCRRCVYACVRENNQSRAPQIHWISVLRFKKGEKWVNDLEGSEKYYNPAKVPEEGYFYMPVQCQQCSKPPCVKVCPTGATWKDPDGIVVVDYNWCIGCRYCMAACPYGARRFNWSDPLVAKEEHNPESHYLGNRPRYKGVVEKCTFCIQRTRGTPDRIDRGKAVRGNPGKYPACVEICPVGARKFGNLLDPESEIRYIIEHKRVFRLKEDLNTYPQFYYYFGA